MSAGIELDPLVEQYQHESQRPRADEALFTLRKIASMVKPIMRRRSWRVGTLAEFYPAQSNLLGLNTNHGQKIQLRLRYPGDASQFLPLEEVLDTMLHELCHNAIGPHNAVFHALWDQLRDEHETLKRKGYTGEGFLGRGQRLGGQRMPLHEAKRRARAAAEQRRTLNAGSGQRLGGSGIMRGQDARAVITAAVERRLRVERGCASGTEIGRLIESQNHGEQRGVTTTQAEQENEDETVILQEYINLIEAEESAIFGQGYVPPSHDNPAGPRGQLSKSSKAQDLVAQQRSIEQQILRQKQVPPSTIQEIAPMPQTTRSVAADLTNITTSTTTKPPITEIETWTCEICTLVNPINYLTCDACTVERPAIYSQQGQPSPPPPPPFGTRPDPRPSPYSRPKKETPNALKPRLSSTQAYEKFEREQAEKVASKPMGWQCSRCGNWMEQEWWTCSACGNMKSSS